MMEKRYNALCDKLAKGNGSVAGMHLLMPITPGEGKALVKVLVVGIDFESKCYGSGVTVIIEPEHGAGRASVGAITLIDDTEDARNLYWRYSDATRYQREHKPKHGVKELRNAIYAGRNRLDKEQREAFDQRVSEMLGSGKEPLSAIALIGKGEEYALDKVWLEMLNIMFNLNDALPD